MKRLTIWIALVLTTALCAPTLAESHTDYSGSLTIDNRAQDGPVAYNTRSPQGRHFIPGMPGTLTFQSDINWDGSPGSVSFTINGTKCQATVTNLGGGKALAQVTIAAPAAVPGASEVRIQVTNGADKTTEVGAGLYFHPLSPLMAAWLADGTHWVALGTRLSFSAETNLTLIDLDWPPVKPVVTTKMSIGFGKNVYYDALCGAFGDSRYGKGGLELEFHNIPEANLDLIVDGSVETASKLDVKFQGLNPPSQSPSWETSGKVKVGAGIPVVELGKLFPPAAGPITAAEHWPWVGDALKAGKVRVFQVFGGSLAGDYSNGVVGPCWLGSTALKGSATYGVEGQLALDFGRHVQAGVYVGGSGTPEFDLCPSFSVNGVTMRVYTGLFLSTYMFENRLEIGTEVHLGHGSSGNTAASAASSPQLLPAQATSHWRPIGDRFLQYGEMNHPPEAKPMRAMSSASPGQSGGSTEQVVVGNVSDISGPCLMANSGGNRMLFPLHDPNKPWYAATDIAYLHADGADWTLDRVTDDQAAEFTPQAAVPGADSTLAAWTRVSGDVSQTTSPDQITPHLDIVVSNLETGSGQWSAPVQLTSNSVVDRNPVPVVFGSNKGMLWVQNEADADPGNATNGDKLMYSGWNGSVWSSPQALWSGKNGLMNLAFVADGAGQGHAVFSVDEDGNLDTRTDRELYQVATTNGNWGSPVRLTNDSVEDSIPILAAPNGQPIVVWNAGGTLNYSRTDIWNPNAVYSEYTISNETATLDGVTMPGGAAVAYTVQLPSGVDIVASFYDASLDMWSLPRQLTDDADVETALSLGCDGSQLVIGYLKNRTVRGPVDVEIDGVMQHLEDIPQPSRTDLCVLRHTLGSDLAAGSITVNPVKPVPGTTATVNATIENRGDLPESAIDVVFFDGDPLSGGTQIGDTQTITGPLAAGTTADVSVSWSVPTDGSSHRVYVIVDADLSVDDRDRSNNTASTLCVLPDLIVETGWSDVVSEDGVAITAKIVNQGVLAAGVFEVGWHVGSPDGPEIGRSPVDSLAAGANAEITYIWRLPEPSTVEFVQICAVADCANVVLEADESNNDGYQSVKVPLYDAPTTLTIGAAKNAQDGAAVYLNAKIVTATFPGCFYIEEPDHSAGVKVTTSALHNVGDAVSVTGRVDASGVEVAINADSVTPATSGTIEPLGLTHRMLGGSGYGLQAGVGGGTGLNNVGLLVRGWGTITAAPEGSGYFYVDDGSALSDGSGSIGIKVYGTPPADPVGKRISVTGICGAELSGTTPIPVIRTRRAGDVAEQSGP